MDDSIGAKFGVLRGSLGATPGPVGEFNFYMKVVLLIDEGMI